MLSVANNHAADWGLDALRDTIKRLTTAKIPFTGGGLTFDQASEPTIITKSGKKFGFLGFCDINYSVI